MVYRHSGDGQCLTENAASFPYESLPCLYPAWGRTYAGFELSYDPVPVRDYMVACPALPVAASLLYLTFIVLGRSYFSSRKPLSWRRVLALWNLSLSVFSFVGFARTLPHLLHNLGEYGLRDCLCNDPESMYGSGPTGLWVQLFILSKFPELVDTLFVIVHKKPLLFLHWYHHFTVLLYCWHSYVTKAPGGLFFVVMNYAVHSFMYGYYFLMSVKLKPKWMNAIWITCAQIGQMVVGVSVTVLSYYYYRRDGDNEEDPCLVKRENNAAAFIMYGSYLVLFLQFFAGRYFRGKKRKEKKGGVDDGKKTD